MKVIVRHASLQGALCVYNPEPDFSLDLQRKLAFQSMNIYFSNQPPSIKYPDLCVVPPAQVKF